MNKIKFISYTGRYPNLCKGILTVEINGKEYKFGHDFEHYHFKENRFDNEDPNNPNFEKFWTSGGSIKVEDKSYRNMYAYDRPWKLNGEYNQADETHPQWVIDLLPQLLYVFNENVEHGCCGGCI